VFLDDPVRDRQAQTRAASLGLGREKRLEDLGQIFLANAHPRVDELDEEAGGPLAGLAGVLSAPLAGVQPAMGTEILTATFVVVVIGGLGSFWGVVVAGLLVGAVRGITVYYYPPAAEASMYLLMVLILLFRPRGLMGEKFEKFE